MTNTELNSLETMLDAEEAPAPEIAPAAPPETGDKDSAAPPADAPAQASPVDDAPSVPRKALEDERRKRQDLERRLQELERGVAQPQQEKTEATTQQQQQQPLPPWVPNVPNMTNEEFEALWFSNPVQAAAIQAELIRAQNEKNYLNRELNRSEKRARKEHGDELVTSAFTWASRAGKAQDFVHEDDPYGALVEAYQAERNALRAEIMAELGSSQPGQAQAAQPAKVSAPVPKSLATRTSSAPRNPSTGQFTSRASLDEILG